MAVPLGYLLSRFRFPGKAIVDAIVDIPIVLPPLVIGLSLLIFFQTRAGQAIEYLTREQMGRLHRLRGPAAGDPGARRRLPADKSRKSQFRRLCCQQTAYPRKWTVPRHVRGS